jgi:hypothetical protein
MLGPEQRTLSWNSADKNNGSRATLSRSNQLEIAGRFLAAILYDIKADGLSFAQQPNTGHTPRVTGAPSQLPNPIEQSRPEQLVGSRCDQRPQVLEHWSPLFLVNKYFDR